MWKDQDTNKVVGTLFNTAQDDNAWHNAFVPAIKKAGFTVVDPGQFPAFGNDFTPQVTAFKKAGVEIVTGNLFTPDFAAFYTQCAQRATSRRSSPSAKPSCSQRTSRRSALAGWGSPAKSGGRRTIPSSRASPGISCKELGATYEKATGKHWTQPIPFKHALFEVVIDVLKRTKNPKDPKSILDAITATNLPTIVGQVKWPAAGQERLRHPGGGRPMAKDGDRLDIAIVKAAISPRSRQPRSCFPLPRLRVAQ